MVSYYQVLGVNEDSSHDEIKQAYRERMKAHHPDRHGQSNDPVAPLITEAYRVLGNPAERERYNKELRLNGGSPPAASKLRRQSSNAKSSPHTQTGARELCPDCEGYGYERILGAAWSCFYCDGQGWVPGKIAL